MSNQHIGDSGIVFPAITDVHTTTYKLMPPSEPVTEVLTIHKVDRTANDAKAQAQYEYDAWFPLLEPYFVRATISIQRELYAHQDLVAYTIRIDVKGTQEQIDSLKRTMVVV